MSYLGVRHAAPAGHSLQFNWLIFPKVVCPSWQAIGGWLVDGHIKPAEQLLQVASPFKEYVPGEQAPDNDMGVGQANPAGHGVQ